MSREKDFCAARIHEDLVNGHIGKSSVEAKPRCTLIFAHEHPDITANDDLAVGNEDGAKWDIGQHSANICPTCPTIGGLEDVLTGTSSKVREGYIDSGRVARIDCQTSHHTSRGARDWH